MRIPIRDIIARAVERPPEYVDDVISSGRVDGDEIEIDEGAMARLRQKYAHGPSVVELVGNYAAAVTRWQLAGRPVVSEGVFRARLLACAGSGAAPACEFWDAAGCRVCGCPPRKLTWATEECPLPSPLQRWGREGARSVHGGRTGES